MVEVAIEVVLYTVLLSLLSLLVLFCCALCCVLLACGKESVQEVVSVEFDSCGTSKRMYLVLYTICMTPTFFA